MQLPWPLSLLPVSLILAGCHASPSKYASIDEALVAMTYKPVSELMRDPESAQFSKLGWSRAGGQTAVCGFVNGRNGFGGMAGPKRFVRLFSTGEAGIASLLVAKGGDVSASEANGILMTELNDLSEGMAGRRGKALPRAIIDEGASEQRFERYWQQYCSAATPTTFTPAPCTEDWCAVLTTEPFFRTAEASK